MLRHNVPVRRDLDQIAADNGFDFHIIDKLHIQHDIERQQNYIQ